ncbi:MAG: Fe(3+) ABC transporter substrate-binding protein [Caulobacterales bacterium]|nr:Fe(3+) ABC transporter substrate-binding protein [Caulobacterales bacterium]
MRGAPLRAPSITYEDLMRSIPFAAVVSFALAASAGLAGARAQESGGEVNLYSSRHYDTDLALYEEFTEATGIKVNWIEANADALIERIQAEGEFSPADLLVTVDAGRLWRAEQAGVLEAVDSEVLEARVPAHLRHPDGLWFGLSKRARVIIYNRAAGMPEPLARYADLADPAHRGTVCIRSSSNIYNISLMASMVSRNGAEAAEEWARGVTANFARPPQSNDTGQIRDVASGECAIAVVNTYYLARLAGSEDEGDRAVADAVGVIFPDQDGAGAHINISGAGLVKGAPNRANAIRFLEYLTDERAQSYFANGNNEYPVVEGVAPTATVVALGAFEEDQLNAAELGRNQAEAVRVFDRAGWR